MDETTVLAHKVIIDYPGNMRPRLSLKDEHGKTGKIPARTIRPVICCLQVRILWSRRVPWWNRETYLQRSRVKRPRPRTYRRSARVAELFEARRPKEQAIVSRSTVLSSSVLRTRACVLLCQGRRGFTRVHDSEGKHVTVHEGRLGAGGEPLMDGSVIRQLLDILCPKEMQRYLVDEVQKVYRLQGVTINDKHIEVIVRHMMRKIRVEDSEIHVSLSRRGRSHCLCRRK